MNSRFMIFAGFLLMGLLGWALGTNGFMNSQDEELKSALDGASDDAEDECPVCDPACPEAPDAAPCPVCEECPKCRKCPPPVVCEPCGPPQDECGEY